MSRRSDFAGGRGRDEGGGQKKFFTEALVRTAFSDIIYINFHTPPNSSSPLYSPLLSLSLSVAYRGGVWGIQTPPEIPKALQNCAKLNPICENC